MSKDTKDLIEIAEKEQISRAQLEKTIEKLKYEINGLKLKLNKREGTTSEIEALKDLVNSQQEELNKKVSESEILELKINNLNKEINELKQISDQSQLPEDAQEAIRDLMENYAVLEETNIELVKKLSEVEKEKTALSAGIQDTGIAEIGTLNEKIENLEKENQELRNNFIINNTQQLERFELENEIENLIQKNAELEELIEKLKGESHSLKSDLFNQTKLETKISSLNEQISLLQNENSNLKQKVIGISNDSYKSPKTQKEEPSVIEIDALEKPDIQSFSPSTRSKVDVYSHESSQTSVIERQVIQETVAPPKVKKIKPVEIIPPKKYSVEQLSIDKSEETTERKRKCPKCGNTSKGQIREVPDKTRPIAYSLYAKKYQCLQCSNEWH